MNRMTDVGQAVGTAAAEQGEHYAVEIANHERQRIELTNDPKIWALRATIAALYQKERDLEVRISRALPLHEARTRTRKAAFYWFLAILLSIGGIVLASIAFEPFQLGWKAWPFCLGIGVVTPFLLDRVLDSWESRNLVRVLQTLACLAALVGAMLLAVVRGNVFGDQIKHENPVVLMDEDAPSTTAPTSAPTAAENFYDRTVVLLEIVMALAALAMELGAGFAVREAQRWSSPAEDGTALRRELGSVRAEMIEHGYALSLLENEGAIFEHSFWRDFYHALLASAARGAIRRLSIIAVGAALLIHGKLYAQSCEDLVVLPDLSQSVAAKDNNGQTEFQKNLRAVGQLIASLPAGSRIAVFGITDDSFGRPYPLLQGQLSSDEGYFKERLAQGRTQLARAWELHSKNLQPVFRETDILGALLLASQHFEHPRPSCRKVLVVFSDMRQATSVLNLEGGRDINVPRALETITHAGFHSDLREVEVYMLGVDAVGEPAAHWRQLKALWTAYFQNAGARVVAYSVLRERSPM